MLRDIRQNYQQNKLEEKQLPAKPIPLFEKWLNEAILKEANEPTAMVLATSINNSPQTRIILLKEIKDEKFIFFTNYNSSKAQQILKNNQVALNFFWPELERQIRVLGTISKLDEIQSTNYFKSRPRDSQLGAWASAQSQVLKNRNELENKYQLLKDQFTNKDIPKPKDWGGYQIYPTEIEFWQGRPNRLHDRILYIRSTQDEWSFNRLSP